MRVTGDAVWRRRALVIDPPPCPVGQPIAVTFDSAMARSDAASIKLRRVLSSNWRIVPTRFGGGPIHPS